MTAVKERQIPTIDVMIDLETLGLKDDAVILQIAVVATGLEICDAPISSFNIYVSPATQPRRSVDYGTLLFWQEQPEEVFNTVAGGTSSLKDALVELNKFIEALSAAEGIGSLQFWCKGDRDFRWLETAYIQEGVNCPWNYWQLADLRTAMALFPSVTPSKPMQVHNAIYDAEAQMQTLQAIRTEISDGQLALDTIND